VKTTEKQISEHLDAPQKTFLKITNVKQLL